MNSEYLFIGEDLQFHKGEDAKVLLSDINDKQFLEEGKGVVRVPKGRWNIAQAYERHTWMDAGAHAFDDRNDEHAVEFENYKSLGSLSFQRAIELGCGPFTNLRVLAKSLDIKSCVLLDPLINSYLGHRNCTYRHGKVKTSGNHLDQILGQSLPGRAMRRLTRHFWPGGLEKGVPVERMFSCPIEEMPDVDAFDLVVMINVIEHCYDAQAIFDKVLKLCDPGTVFVFHDRLFDVKTVVEDVNTRFDAGHPLRVNGTIITNFLHENFLPILEKEIDIVDSIGDIDLTERGIYFIGKRH